jgi:uncharacterized membrane protein
MVNDNNNEPGIELRLGDFFLGMPADLLIVIGFTLLTLAFIYVPVLDQTFIRSALGLVMILFVPGYAFIAALFPGKKDIDAIERTALSFGLSIAISPLIGLGLNYTPWGIRMDPIVVCLVIFTFVCVFVANKRRHMVEKEERFYIDFAKVYRQTVSEAFGGDNTQLDKSLTIVLVISIVLCLAVLAYVVVVPKTGETFTEFYILGPDGMADNYNTTFTLGDQHLITVGVANHESQNMVYDLVVTLENGTDVTRLNSQQFTVLNNQTWEKTISVKPDQVGNNMEMEFLLYAYGNTTAPYRECHLWVNVTAPVTANVTVPM